MKTGTAELSERAAWLALAVGGLLVATVASGWLRVTPLQLRGSALLQRGDDVLADFAMRGASHLWVALGDSVFTLCYAVAFAGLWFAFERGSRANRLLLLACLAGIAVLVPVDLAENALSALLASAPRGDGAGHWLDLHARLTDFKWGLSALVFGLFGLASWQRSRWLAGYAAAFAGVVACGFAQPENSAIQLARGPLAALSMLAVARSAHAHRTR